MCMCKTLYFIYKIHHNISLQDTNACPEHEQNTESLHNHRLTDLQHMVARHRRRQSLSYVSEKMLVCVFICVHGFVCLRVRSQSFQTGLPLTLVAIERPPRCLAVCVRVCVWPADWHCALCYLSTPLSIYGKMTILSGRKNRTSLYP